MLLAKIYNEKAEITLTETKRGKNVKVQNAVGETSAALVSLFGLALRWTTTSWRSAHNSEGNNKGNGRQELHSGGCFLLAGSQRESGIQLVDL
jgi:hypothetical protein